MGGGRKPDREVGKYIGSFQDLWEKFLETLTSNSQALCALVLRHIRMQRNTFMHEGKFLHPKQFIYNAIQQLDSYQEVWSLSRSGAASSNQQPRLPNWLPPNPG